MFFELGAQFSAEPATFNPNQCSPHCPSCFILTRQPVASKTDPDKVPCRPHASPIRILPEQDAVSNMVFNFAALFLNVFSNFPQISHKFPTTVPHVSQTCPPQIPHNFFGRNSLLNLFVRAPEKIVGRLVVGPLEICGLHKTCF